MTIHITNHAYKRCKERFGWKKQTIIDKCISLLKPLEDNPFVTFPTVITDGGIAWVIREGNSTGHYVLITVRLTGLKDLKGCKDEYMVYKRHTFRTY